MREVTGERTRDAHVSADLNAVKNVGAGLLAKAVCQLQNVLTDPPPSRASPLPHLVLCKGFRPSVPVRSAYAALQPSAAWSRIEYETPLAPPAD
ncbi:hypothetical protein PflCFBP13514_25680 [Pseudomonas fluorescens]|nr:hypothetical protein PflCFBP13514_25680 [Pseudomonas fluorescens]